MKLTFIEQTQSLANNKKPDLKTQSPFNKQNSQFKFNQNNCLQKQISIEEKCIMSNILFKITHTKKEPGK